MPGNDLGPPGKERPGGYQAARPDQKISHTTTTAKDNRSGVRQPYDVLAGQARRFCASRKMVPLGQCGCIRDPEYDRHRCHGPTDRMVEAGAQAARHLLAAGLPPLGIELEVLRALWRRPDDRAIAQRLYTLAGGDA